MLQHINGHLLSEAGKAFNKNLNLLLTILQITPFMFKVMLC